MTNFIDTTSLINTWMNGRRQFWDLWLDGSSSFEESENSLLNMQGNKQLKDTLRSLTHTMINAQEKMLTEYCEHFSKIAGQTDLLSSDYILTFWKKEIEDITEKQKNIFSGSSPLFDLYNPQKALEKFEELSATINKNINAIEQGLGKEVSGDILLDPTEPAKKAFPEKEKISTRKSNTKRSAEGMQ